MLGAPWTCLVASSPRCSSCRSTRRTVRGDRFARRATSARLGHASPRLDMNVDSDQPTSFSASDSGSSPTARWNSTFGGGGTETTHLERDVVVVVGTAEVLRMVMADSGDVLVQQRRH